MQLAMHLAGPRGIYALRVLRAIDRQRLAAVALVTLLLSLGSLFSPTLLDFFTPAQIALEWLQHLGELALVAMAMTFAYTLADEVLPRSVPLRRAQLSLLLLAMSAVATLLLYAWYAKSFEHLPPPQRVLTDSLRFAVPAVFLAHVAEMHRRALQADAAAQAAESTREQLVNDEGDQQLALASGADRAAFSVQHAGQPAPPVPHTARSGRRNRCQSDALFARRIAADAQFERTPDR